MAVQMLEELSGACEEDNKAVYNKRLHDLLQVGCAAGGWCWGMSGALMLRGWWSDGQAILLQ